MVGENAAAQEDEGQEDGGHEDGGQEDRGRGDRIRELAYRMWEEEGRPEGAADRFWHQAEAQIARDEALYDKTLADSFPASDPPSHSGIT